ncbi:MAG TPA: FitA-like ribbon-helix-helix domain-containing protein [Candidatus Brocadiaceae bacterium]
MSQLLIRNLEEETIELLKKQAKLHNRSLQGEVKQILEENIKMSIKDARIKAKKIRASFRKKIFSDSADLIRGDRNR